MTQGHTALLRERPNHSFEVHQALKIIQSQCLSENFELPLARRFPVRVVLSEFAAALASPESAHINSLLSFIVERIKRRTDQELSVPDFRQWLIHYPWILILDGLDEVPASSNREEVLTAIRDFWIEATESNADILVIATTRPQGFSTEDFPPEAYQYKYLAPLSSIRAMHYAQRLAEVRYAEDQDRKDKVLVRLERASKHEATARLMRSPLQVTIMTMLVAQKGQPPQERWNLFNQYYEVIYQREAERDDVPSAVILNEYEPEIDTIHNRVGLMLQVESERTGKTEARLSAEQFEKIVAARLDEEKHTGKKRQELLQRIIEASANRLVFLVGMETNQVGFEIRSLQEFMAAEGLMDGADEDVGARLREIASVPNWRNVFLFAAGKCFAKRQHLRDTIHTICAELNEEKEDRLAGTTLAGSQLALDLLEDGPARRQPKYAQVLARLALRLLDQPPDENHTRLASMYEDELTEVYRKELLLRLSSKQASQRLGAWACLIPLIEANVGWAKQEGEASWPENENEQIELLQFSRNPGAWLLPKLIDVFLHFSPVELSKREVNVRLVYVKDGAPIIHVLKTYAQRVPSNGNMRVPLLSSESVEETLKLYINGMDEESNVWLKSLHSVSGTSPAWYPFVAAGRFLKEPSRFTLASELRFIVPQFDRKLLEWAGARLPWPIAACLKMASSESELQEIADQAEAGRFGNLDEWNEAERRWSEKGITTDDLMYMTDDRLPFDKHIGEIGFPFIVARTTYFLANQLSYVWFYFSSRRKGHALRDTASEYKVLAELYGRTSEGLLKAVLRRWLLEGYTFLKSGFLYSSAIDATGINEIAEAVISEIIHNQEELPLGMLSPFISAEELVAQKEEFLDRIGRYEQLRSTELPLSASQALIEAFTKNNSRLGILRLLAFINPPKGAPSIPTALLKPELYDDPMFREAAIIVRLSQGDLRADEVESYARHSAALAVQSSEIIEAVVEKVVNRQPLLQKENEDRWRILDKFLLHLRSELPTSKWKSIGQINRQLNNSLKRRTSRLTDFQVWSNLQLPKSLYELLSQ